MSDYIERQKVKDIRFSGGINHDGFLYVPYKELVDGIKALPSADVVQVVHGRWENYSPITIKCSRCGHVIHDWRYSECKYCPNCGAKMDGERKE